MDADLSANSHGRSFCIFYGWLVADADGKPAPSALRIAARAPKLLIAPAHTVAPRMPNLSPQVMRLFDRHSITVLAYVDAGFRLRAPDIVLVEAAEALSMGVGGILFDQVEHRWSAHARSFYAALAEGVRAAHAIVALNTGVAETDEAVMEVADLLMVEHRWRAFGEHNPWRQRYHPLRFMGVSSNEPGALAHIDHHVDANAAAHDTYDAWRTGVGWHCATDRFVDLPPWF